MVNLVGDINVITIYYKFIQTLATMSVINFIVICFFFLRWKCVQASSIDETLGFPYLLPFGLGMSREQKNIREVKSINNMGCHMNLGPLYSADPIRPFRWSAYIYISAATTVFFSMSSHNVNVHVKVALDIYCCYTGSDISRCGDAP